MRKYSFGTPRKKAFLRTVIPHIAKQNQTITADRNQLVPKQYDARWSPTERARLKDVAARYRVKWSDSTRHVLWNALLERVNIILDSMVATMAVAESDWGTSKLAREDNNLFGMKRGAGRCRGAMKGYSQFESVEQSVQAYVANLNAHPAYSSFRKLRLQLHEVDQKMAAGTMIHKLEGYSTKGSSYNNYLFAIYQDNQRLIAVHL